MANEVEKGHEGCCNKPELQPPFHVSSTQYPHYLKSAILDEERNAFLWTDHRIINDVCEFLNTRASTTELATTPIETDVNKIAADVLEVCKQRGWSLHWTHRGAYLHLESSELIEAVRGKRGDVLGEAGDVLLVLMSITENMGIPFSTVIDQAKRTANNLKTKPHYAGEEFALPAPPEPDHKETHDREGK